MISDVKGLTCTNGTVWVAARQATGGYVGGLYRTWDGATLTNVLANAYMRHCAVNPLDGAHIVAVAAMDPYFDGASAVGGMWESRDVGDTWSSIALNAGHPGGGQRVAFEPDGTLLVATMGLGVWRAI